MSDKDGQLSSREFALAGAISGFITRFSCQPLDVVKILFQLQVDPKSTSKYSSIIQTLNVIAKEEGIYALWKGHVPAQFLSVLFGAVQFSLYEKLIDLSQDFDSNNILFSNNAIHFYSGGIAGITAVTVSFPFDTIRTRLVAQHKSQLYKGMIDAARHIMVHEGPRGYFRGLLAACIQIAPTSGLTFGFKNLYNQIWNFCFCESNESFKITTTGHVITGLLAGITSKTLVYPLDVIKKRLQIQGMDKKSLSLNRIPECKGFRDCLYFILKYEGFWGLYRGILPAMIKSGVSNSIYFATYHEICQFLNFKKR